MIKAAALSCLLVCCFAVASARAAGAPLFPTPLHLTRQVHDTISDKTAVLDEYGYGNRLVSIRGARTSIADYEKGELIEIDRDAGTYSVTRFDAVARANQIVNPPAQSPAAGPAATAAPSDHAVRSLGVKMTKSGRSAEFFEAEIGTAQEKQTVTVAVDRAATVSKDALEVLVGAAFPGVRTGAHEVILSAAALGGRAGRISATGAGDAYALPVEQVTSVAMDGGQAEFRSTVVRVGAEAPPADLVAIPAGARLVKSRLVEVANELETATRPTAPPGKAH
jgi:hypothetical protein